MKYRQANLQTTRSITTTYKPFELCTDHVSLHRHCHCTLTAVLLVSLAFFLFLSAIHPRLYLLSDMHNFIILQHYAVQEFITIEKMPTFHQHCAESEMTIFCTCREGISRELWTTMITRGCQGNCNVCIPSVDHLKMMPS